MAPAKNDIEWQKIFDKHQIVETVLAQGRAYISSTEINLFREARLMTKFDHQSQLPEIFVKHKLTILPTSRGGYVIGKMVTFHHFEQSEPKTTRMNFPVEVESLDHRDITSESIAINCAFIAGILHDFMGESDLYPTVSGRMSSSTFDYTIDSASGPLKIGIENAQLEIDGGYEGPHSLAIIEAKNYLSSDFLIRQLYYPFRLWANKIRKKVRPIFLTYTNGLFHLREYAFTDPNHYNSLELVQQKKYALGGEQINIETIQQLLAKTKIVQEPAVPFPQANSFARLVNLCELLKHKEELPKVDITANYDFDQRQTEYYTNAGKYLGLIAQKKENGQTVFFLTDKGKEILDTAMVDRQLEFVKLILAHSVFNQILKEYFATGQMTSNREIVSVMKLANLYKVEKGETFNRRASTVKGWINWILGLIEE